MRDMCRCLVCRGGGGECGERERWSLAAADGQNELMMLLLLRNTRVDARELAEEGLLGVLEVLLGSEQLDVSEKNEDGETALYSAC